MFSEDLGFFSANFCLVVDGNGAFGFEVGTNEADVSFGSLHGSIKNATAYFVRYAFHFIGVCGDIVSVYKVA